MELYIVRHAQSANNALADASQRVCDPALTELGRRQTEILARHLATGVCPEAAHYEPGRDRRGFGLARLYTSPMRRALQTAQPTGRALRLRPIVWVDLHEEGGVFLDHGDGRGRVGYPGRTRAEMLAEFPEFDLPEGVTERGWWSGGFEEKPALGERALRVAAILRSWAPCPERIAILSHGGFADALLKALLGEWPRDDIFYFHYNTAISRLDLHPDGRLDVRYLNRLDHLPPDLIS